MAQNKLQSIYNKRAEASRPLKYLLPAAQLEAKRQWQEVGLPLVKTDDWRQTKVISHLPVSPQFVFGGQLKDGLVGDNKKSFVLPQAWTVVVVNGNYQPELSDLVDLPRGVMIKSFVDVPADILRTFFNKTIVNKNNGLAALNAALLRDGLFILVPAQTSLKKPIQIKNIFTGSAAAVMQPRFLAVVEKKSTVDIVITNEVVGRGRPFISKVDEIVLAEDGLMNILTLAMDVKLKLFSQMAVDVGGGSRLNSFTVNRGKGFVHLGEQVRLRGQGAAADLSGLYECQRNGRAETSVVVEHLASQTTSAVLYQGLAQGAARTFFRGEVVVNSGLQGVASTLRNKNILLSKSAQMQTEPYLKIFSDDVRCYHGATVGEFSPDDIFYFRARGMSFKRAQQLLKTAFINDILNRVPICSLGRPLESLLKN